MPIHDWSQVDAGCFHHFHLSWACRISDALNSGPPAKGAFSPTRTELRLADPRRLGSLGSPVGCRTALGPKPGEA